MKMMPICPRCFTQLVIRKSRLGIYFACPNYPNCKRPVYLPKQLQPDYEYASAA